MEIMPSFHSLLPAIRQRYARQLMPTQRIVPRAQLLAIGALEASSEVDAFDVTAQIRHRRWFRAIFELTESGVLHRDTMPKPQVVFDVQRVHLYEQTTRVFGPIARAYADQPW
jgi:hypothetical protein